MIPKLYTSAFAVPSGGRDAMRSSSGALHSCPASDRLRLVQSSSATSLPYLKTLRFYFIKYDSQRCQGDGFYMIVKNCNMDEFILCKIRTSLMAVSNVQHWVLPTVASAYFGTRRTSPFHGHHLLAAGDADRSPWSWPQTGCQPHSWYFSGFHGYGFRCCEGRSCPEDSEQNIESDYRNTSRDRYKSFQYVGGGSHLTLYLESLHIKHATTQRSAT